MFTATLKVTGQAIKGIPQNAEEHLLQTAYWCAASQIAGLVDYLVSCPAAVSADSADFRVTREEN